MKKLFLSISLIMLAAISFGQDWWQINFDPPYYQYVKDRIVIDTSSTSNCIWQVGSPSKTNFSSAFSLPNAIVTDTLNPIPPSDTSIFYIKHVKSYDSWDHFTLYFQYIMDGDSTDFGMVEISPDFGNTWINLLTQDSTYNIYFNSPKPTLTGSTNGWQTFFADMTTWSSGWTGLYPVEFIADTVVFRFTYISDSNSTPHDGWMLDDFQIEDWTEGIPEVQNDDLISIYPNPADESIYILKKINTTDAAIKVFNLTGQLILSNSDFTGESLDTKQLRNGVYLLKYSDSKSYCFKKFVVQH